jgi:hypothetical protein
MVIAVDWGRFGEGLDGGAGVWDMESVERARKATMSRVVTMIENSLNY